MNVPVNMENNVSAKNAANALVAFDATLAESIKTMFEGRGHYEVSHEEKTSLLCDVAGTWTLSIAAAAASVTEHQVLVALARYYMHCGTQMASENTVRSALTTN
jgi:hypothetical protein